MTIEKSKPQWSATANLRERWKSLNPWNQTDSFCLSIIGRPSARDMRTSCLCKYILPSRPESLDGLSYTCSMKSLNCWSFKSNQIVSSGEQQTLGWYQSSTAALSSSSRLLGSTIKEQPAISEPSIKISEIKNCHHTKCTVLLKTW